MNQTNWYDEHACSLDDFERDLAQEEAHPPRHAASVQRGIPLYDCAALGSDPSERMALQAEWAEVLRAGAGVLVLKHAYADIAPIDDATAVFEDIIRQEREQGTSRADHFAKAGANDRIWNAQEKLCLQAPDVFARYFANPFLACMAEAWLGPAYQMTSQVNVVRPGGAAQEAHRDYHLGFQTEEEVRRYPAHVHAMSPFLTLQGAVAHSDMPVESGPTKLLPFSQRYAPGYLAWRRADFRAYFEAHCVQLPLEKGDALFFSPALFHAAGANHTRDVQRMANLLQVSSAYGRAMESVDRARLCEAVYPVLSESKSSGRMSDEEIEAVIASCAEGYAFPTNLDRDPPSGGLAPPSQQVLLREALHEGWPVGRFTDALRQHAWKRTT
ncbi:phytanoyl-CoA dioxygenase family protein [Caballeronia sp. LZ034LL]|uniref:phytanoyl-CoA dioxygenase family protein n=1 Tax=Caballeronia sp. LZ034LL TaxID=3038567 RepID=UPI0028583C5C|nr:phytanoyl-CoA dioxygenase family protein [Caballeronia sp. LZ034LL]MDR5836464.1 phytanoyl-CoA dioxygenase family protein [Caballeronia sp. LZ034LL]